MKPTAFTELNKKIVGSEHLSFSEQVYAELLKVPRGKVTTYGALAQKMKSSARAIGQVMRTNPYAPHVPCHRVISSTGKIGGFMGETSGEAITKKVRLLKAEGVDVREGKIVSFEEKLYKP